MDIILWLLIVLCFILSFIGLIFPLIPSVLALWVGFFVYVFGLAGDLSIWFWIGMGVLTIILFGADIIASQFFVKKYGGSKWGERIAAIGVIVGSFIYPPFGIIVLPFLLVFVVEMLGRNDPGHALKVATASFIAFLSGTFAKAVVQLVMIIWFILEAIWR